MNSFILVWVLANFDGSRGLLTYSPPVQTLEDCQRLQKFVSAGHWGRSQCIQINILRGQK